MPLISSDNWQSGRTLCQSANFMLANKIATNVTFKFPNTTTTVEAHRFVLMARSHVFYFMLNSSLNKPGVAITISDIEPAMFKEFIRYLYSDETTLSVEKAFHLTYCAEKYEVTDLKSTCMDFLKTQVDKTTVAMILDHAVLYNDDMLISTCQDIIEALESLSCLEEHHVTKDTMELVLGFQGLAVGELDIFKFCNTWAEHECTIQDVPINASNRRKMLGPLLRKIPFCSMTQEQFATEVSGKDLLNGQEELEIFCFICASDESNPPFPCKTKIFTKETLQLPWKSKKACNLTNWKLKTNHIRHTGHLNHVTVSPDDSLCASGDKDGQIRLCDLKDYRHLHILDSGEMINALCFSPRHFWLCAATGPSIKIWDLEGRVIIDEIRHKVNMSSSKAEPPQCICLTWSPDGRFLFAGYTNNLIRVWQVRNLTHWQLRTIHIRHTGYLNCMTISHDGTLCASGGKDGQAMLWDLSDGKHLHTLYVGDIINALCFSPKHFWICAATGPSIKIWDLESKVMVDELRQEVISSTSKAEPPHCICLAWSADGQSLFAGYTDNLIHIWQVSMAM